jgi:hypothetical protein
MCRSSADKFDRPNEVRILELADGGGVGSTTGDTGHGPRVASVHLVSLFMLVLCRATRFRADTRAGVRRLEMAFSISLDTYAEEFISRVHVGGS